MSTLIRVFDPVSSRAVDVRPDMAKTLVVQHGWTLELAAPPVAAEVEVAPVPVTVAPYEDDSHTFDTPSFTS